MMTIKTSLLLGTVLLALQAEALHAQSLTTLHGFGTNADGQFPSGGVAISSNTLFGSTVQGDNGSNYRFGVLYSVNTSGSNYTILHSFSGADGQNASSTPLISGNTLYGTASGGGSGSGGVLYSMDMSGSNYTVLHPFDSGAGGQNPKGDLLLDGGTLYGTTTFLGSNGYGTVYSITTNGSNFSVLHSFSNVVNGGQEPYFGPLVLTGGVLYGMTLQGGSNGLGQIYSVNTNGSGFNVIHTFSQAGGANPFGSLVLSGSTLYGTTQAGGSNGLGTVFSIDISGTNYQQLHAFGSAPDGNTPQCTLTLSGGKLYGTTGLGGSANAGTVFSLNTDGSGYSVAYNFTALVPTVGGTNSDGASPLGTLLVSGNQFYGIASLGGPEGVGTVYKLSLYPAFFSGEVALKNGVYYLAFPDTTLFGYYSYNAFPIFFHFDMGFEYFFDANDGQGSAYFYDYTSSHFWYTNPTLFPYLYDFSLSAWIYYYPDTMNVGHYTTNPRYFYNFGTSKIFTQ